MCSSVSAGPHFSTEFPALTCCQHISANRTCFATTPRLLRTATENTTRSSGNITINSSSLTSAGLSTLPSYNNVPEKTFSCFSVTMLNILTCLNVFDNSQKLHHSQKMISALEKTDILYFLPSPTSRHNSVLTCAFLFLSRAIILRPILSCFEFHASHFYLTPKRNLSCVVFSLSFPY